MDWKVSLAAFGAIFVAELGDKTQVATLALAAGKPKLAVFFGASLALVATTAVAVLLGEAVGRVVPDLWLRRTAGVTFMVLGLFYLLAKPA